MKSISLFTRQFAWPFHFITAGRRFHKSHFITPGQLFHKSHFITSGQQFHNSLAAIFHKSHFITVGQLFHNFLAAIFHIYTLLGVWWIWWDQIMMCDLIFGFIYMLRAQLCHIMASNGNIYKNRPASPLSKHNKICTNITSFINENNVNKFQKTRVWSSILHFSP